MLRLPSTSIVDPRPIGLRLASLVLAASAGILLCACDRSGTSGSDGVVQTGSAAPNAPSAGSEPAAGSAPSSAQDEPVDGLPPVRVEPEVLDFGIVPPSVEKEGTVRLVNTGNKELEILTVQPSCKCTTLDDVAGKKIPVGGFVELRTTMKAQSAPGRKGADIKVLIDGYSQVVPIQLKQEVSLPIRVSPSYLNVVKGQPTRGRTLIESIDKQPFRICAVGGKKPKLADFDPEKDEPRSQYFLDWDFERDFAPGEAKRYWIVETDRADCPLVDIFVRHETTVLIPKGIAPTEYRHTFGRQEQGSTYDFVLELTKMGPDEKIVAAASASSAARVELVDSKLEGDVMRVFLRVVPSADAIGVTWIPFMVYSSAGRQVEQAVWGQYVPKGHVGCFGR
jgi:hypothetical protein